jgi:hypothetical protein
MPALALVGAGIGAGAGYAIAGTATAALTGASIGASIGGGYDQLNTAYDNAAAVRVTGQYNAQHAVQVARYNASVARTVATANAGLALMGATASSQATTAITDYNARLQRAVSEYNASLLEDDAELIWQASELDVFQFERAAQVMRGAARAAYGASGVVLDISTDTPSQVMLDMETEAALEVAIMRHNADIQAGRLLNAAAQSRWEGQVMANKILYEGYTSASLTMLQGAMGAAAELGLGYIQANQIEWQGARQAENILRNAWWGSEQYKQQGQQQLVDGLFRGLGYYANYRGATAAASPSSALTRVTPISGAGGGYVPPVGTPTPSSGGSLLLSP